MFVGHVGTHLHQSQLVTWWVVPQSCAIFDSLSIFHWRSICPFFLADSPIFCIIWRMNNGFYLLAIYFFKYTFQQILYLFSISFKYYFFILFLFFLYSFLTAIFFKFPILIFLKFHNIFKFCSKKRTRGDNFFFLSIVWFCWLTSIISRC